MHQLKENLINLRKQSGRSQEELANILGKTRSCYAFWESDKGVEPGLDDLIRIAAFHKVTVDDLLGVSNGSQVGSTKQKFFMQYSIAPDHVKKAIDSLLKI